MINESMMRTAHRTYRMTTVEGYLGLCIMGLLVLFLGWFIWWCYRNRGDK
jgi:hypothetical protein